jgi:hypothetical protein
MALSIIDAGAKPHHFGVATCRRRWLASDASSLVTAAQIPADKGYPKI